MDNGCHPSLEDSEGNTPLHVKCYGETDQQSETAAIDLLLQCGAKLTMRNSRVSIYKWLNSYQTPVREMFL